MWWLSDVPAITKGMWSEVLYQNASENDHFRNETVVPGVQYGEESMDAGQGRAGNA
jgi:hypothetical protein